jgi:hypothetical protein
MHQACTATREPITYELSVRLNGRAVSGSPVTFTVVREQTDAASCQLVGTLPAREAWMRMVTTLTTVPSTRGGVPAATGERAWALTTTRMVTPTTALAPSASGGAQSDVVLGAPSWAASAAPPLQALLAAAPCRAVSAAASVPKGTFLAAAGTWEEVIGPGTSPMVVITPEGTLISRHEVDVEAGASALLWLLARDRYGNVRKAGGDDFKVHLAPVSLSAGAISLDDP